MGIIGISEGNGHPYSWSSIFNGFDVNEMKKSNFPIIAKYLSKQNYPQDFLSDARVTHIWTQDIRESIKVANAAKIPNICSNYLDMVNKIDALLLARDDAQNHMKFAKPFLNTRIPIYIDKPIALNVDDAKKLYQLEKNNSQIFTCSALRYAKEFQISSNLIDQVGDIQLIKAFIPKKWETYAVHVIEPVISQLSKFRSPTHTEFFKKDNMIKFCYLNKKLSFEIFYGGLQKKGIEIIIFGDKGNNKMVLKDSFSAFKQALSAFTDFVVTRKNHISKKLTLDVVRMIEMGNSYD